MPPTRIVNSPSGGKKEVRAILLRVNARGGRKRGLPAIKRYVPVRQRSDIQAILDALVTDGDVARTGASGNAASTYGLTSQGLVKARSHPEPPLSAVPAEKNT